MTEFMENDWPDIMDTDKNTLMVSIPKEQYERARLTMAYCSGITDETLRSIVECNRKLAEHQKAQWGKQ